LPTRRVFSTDHPVGIDRVLLVLTPELRAARVATSLIFAVHGAVTGTFAARLPWLADHEVDARVHFAATAVVLGLVAAEGEPLGDDHPPPAAARTVGV
jgi:hypothetical protein